jgi:hypothetical protein
MDRFRRQSDSSEDSPPASPCHSSDGSQHAGKFWEAHHLQVVVPDINLGDSDALQRVPFCSMNLTGANDKSVPGSPFKIVTPQLSGGQHSARRVLHCSRNSSYSDVSNWLDQQICMRESARAQRPGGLLRGGAAAAMQNNGSSLTTPESDGLSSLGVRGLQVAPAPGSNCRDIGYMALQGPVRAHQAVFLAGDGDEVPPPAFRLLGLL